MTQGSHFIIPPPVAGAAAAAVEGAASRLWPAAARLATSGGTVAGTLPPGVKRPTMAGSR